MTRLGLSRHLLASLMSNFDNICYKYDDVVKENLPHERVAYTRTREIRR